MCLLEVGGEFFGFASFESCNLTEDGQQVDFNQSDDWVLASLEENSDCLQGAALNGRFFFLAFHDFGDG